MRIFPVTNSRRQTSLFMLGALPSLLLALYTQHGWEDWFITFRAAKNLAMGYGLVFQPGQVLQTFTSPLNVLLPAALSWITGNMHDDLVLWLYRLICAGLLGCTVLVLDRLVRIQAWSFPARAFVLAFFLVDAKIMDFSINGQEAAFLVFFMSLMVLALIESRALLLGVAWAGLMWSRPDSFIYIAGAGCGYLLAIALEDRTLLGASCKRFFTAGLLTILLYSPWLIWTTWYYGSPISHTIVAKGLGATHPSPLALLLDVFIFPVQGLLNLHSTTLNSLFMPSYYYFGGWPVWLTVLSRLLGFVSMLAWILPRAARMVRTSSLALFFGMIYLQYVVPLAYPWYFPSCIFLAIVTLGGLFQMAVMELTGKAVERRLLFGAATAVVLVWLGVSLAMAWEMRIQQSLIETGERKQIGLWLKQHSATAHDTVFVECLGYIGFYSGLKMYDYPGMSSPEMVAARRKYGEQTVLLIAALTPDWLVLRPKEANALHAHDPLFLKNYQLAAFFDKSAEVAAFKFLPGRKYLEMDQSFLIFHRQSLAAAASIAPQRPEILEAAVVQLRH